MKALSRWGWGAVVLVKVEEATQPFPNTDRLTQRSVCALCKLSPPLPPPVYLSVSDFASGKVTLRMKKKKVKASLKFPLACRIDTIWCFHLHAVKKTELCSRTIWKTPWLSRLFCSDFPHVSLFPIRQTWLEEQHPPFFPHKKVQTLDHVTAAPWMGEKESLHV